MTLNEITIVNNVSLWTQTVFQVLEFELQYGFQFNLKALSQTFPRSLTKEHPLFLKTFPISGFKD